MCLGKTELKQPRIVNEERHQALEVWHIIVSLVSEIIFGILIGYMAWFCHCRWFTKRKPEQSSEQPTEAETAYEELDLSKMNTEDYQSLRGNVSRINDVDSGVASFDNWRGKYSYICVHRP